MSTSSLHLIMDNLLLQSLHTLFKYLGIVNATNRRAIDVQQELQLPESLGQDITNMPTTKSLMMKIRKAKPAKLCVMSVLVGCLPLPEPAGPGLLVTSHI